MQLQWFMQWLLPIILLPCIEVNDIKNCNPIWVVLYACLVWLHWQRRLKVTYLESWIVVRIFNALECSLIFVAARNFSVLWHFYYAKNSKVFWNFDYVGYRLQLVAISNFPKDRFCPAKNLIWLTIEFHSSMKGRGRVCGLFGMNQLDLKS